MRTINNTKYCQANTFILIDSDMYKNEILPLNLFAIILLGLIFPLILSFFLIKGYRQKNLKKISFERKLGILYLEYKEKHFYWELIIIFLKITTVVLSIKLSNYYKVKGIFVVFLLVTYLFFLFKVLPYKTKTLNT